MLTWLLVWRWPVLVTGGDPARTRGPVASGHSHGKLQQGWARRVSSRAGPVIRHQRHTSILAIVLRHHPHISSSEGKVRRKELVFACLSELRRECYSLCEQPELVVLADFIFWSHAIGCQMSRPGWLLLLADWLSI